MIERKFNRRVMKIVVLPANAAIYSEQCTEIEVVDEGGGEFIQISQPSKNGNIALDRDEWPAVRAAIDDIVSTLMPLDDDPRSDVPC